MDEELTINNIEGKIIDDFEILEKFSSGGFSSVHIAKHLPTNTFCAAKVIDLMEQSASAFTGIMREISVFMQTQHENLSTFFRFSFKEPLLIFFMEYSPNGTLLQYVNRSKGLEENEARRLFLQLFNVMRYLHSVHFLVHRDLKLENILLDKNNNVKLIDFGLAGTYYNNMCRTFVGTPGYQAPEILAGGEYGEKCDVWSLGVLLYSMLTASLPFSTKLISMRHLLQASEEFQPPPAVSPHCANLIKLMLQGRADKRPSLHQLQSHPWLRGLPPVNLRVASKPISFYNVEDPEDIPKFRRNPCKVDMKIVEKCESEYNIDKELLLTQLGKGEVTNETTIYFILTNPLTEQPVTAPPAPALPPLPPLPPVTRKRTKAPAKDPTILAPLPKRSSSRLSVPTIIPKLPQGLLSKGVRNSIGSRINQVNSSRS